MMINRIVIALLALVLYPLSAEAARTVLNGPVTLFFNPSSGNDISGDGSAASPFQTPCGAFNHPTKGLVVGYDLNGHSILVQQQAAGEFHCSLNINGKLVGQTGTPTQVMIQGDTTGDLLNVPNFLWSAPPYTSALTIALGAHISVKGFKFDNWYALHGPGSGESSSRIMILVGWFSSMFAHDIVFGYDANAVSAFVNVQNFGALQMFGNMGFDSQPAGGWTTCAFGVGEQAQLIIPTDGDGIHYVAIRGSPRFLYGFLCLDDLSWAHWVASYFFNWDTVTSGVVATGAIGSTTVTVNFPTLMAPGFSALAPQVPFGTKVTATNGNVVTLDKPLTAAMATSPIRFGWATADIKDTLTFNIKRGSLMVTGGTMSFFPGRVVPTIGLD